MTDMKRGRRQLHIGNAEKQGIIPVTVRTGITEDRINRMDREMIIIKEEILATSL